MTDEDARFTVSGIPQKAYYTREDVADASGRGNDPEVPGEPYYARGIFSEGYRRQHWMESLACGYGLGEDTNQRARYLADVGHEGYTGRKSINLVFDRPTFCGLDSDHPMGQHEVGIVGVAIDCLDDMRRLFAGFDLANLNVGFIVDRSGPFIMAMYVALADELGVPRDQLRGIVCNNPLSDMYASKTPVYPPADCLRLMVDCISFCDVEVPNFNISRINGYNTRELGSTAVQEIGFNLAIARTIVAAGVEAGLDVDRFAGKINFQFSQGSAFFEDICKIRAARRMWARLLKDDFGARSDKACRMKIHMQTAGSSLTAQEPLNNIARVSLQVMSAALAGSQSVHVASYDEALGIPTEEAVRVAIKTSKIVMHESGVADVADPLGGSYYVESLTDEIEHRATELMAEVERSGGVIAALESGWFEQEIADAALAMQQDIDDGERVVVGVNRYREPAEPNDYEVFRHDPNCARVATERLAKLREDRNSVRATACIEAISAGARQRGELMPCYIEAAKANVTLGEMVAAVESVYGRFRYQPIVGRAGRV